MSHRWISALWLYATLVLFVYPTGSKAFSSTLLTNRPTGARTGNKSQDHVALVRHHGLCKHNQCSATREFYEYDGMKCSYEYQPAASSNTARKTSGSPSVKVLLIHPVGIGLCNWFWDKVFRLHSERSLNLDMYAINLVGCGQSRQNEIVDNAYFLQLDAKGESPWLLQCEYFLEKVMNSNDGDSMIVSQGGLAPIAIQLAARNSKAISSVILASPPTPQQLQDVLDPTEAQTNWRKLRNLPSVAFSLLETATAIRFFSNLFLFQSACDDTWLQNALHECDRSVRPAVCYFNAGMCEVPSLKAIMDDMSSMKMLVLRGDGDRRRDTFRSDMTPDCKLSMVDNATNVIPWEAPNAFVDLLESFSSQKARAFH